MNRTDKILVSLYTLLAAMALFATWSNNLAFFALPDNGGLAGFIRAANANPAAASIAWDVSFVCLAAFVFMFVEGRRLGVRYIWLYMLLSLCIAISVMFPLFLAARQMRIARTR